MKGASTGPLVPAAGLFDRRGSGERPITDVEWEPAFGITCFSEWLSVES